MWLMIRMYFAVALFFGVVYALLVVAGSLLGIGSFLFYGILATGFMIIQFLIGPKIVEWSMRVRYVTENIEPELHKMVTELAEKAGIPKPKIGISATRIPNAFAFGKSRGDGRVCVTQGILDLLTTEELKAVLAHEISHIKNRDMVVMTTISVIPTIAWYIAWGSMFSGGNDENNGAALGIVAFLIYLITNLLVLYVSRIREYYADRGAIKLGSKPHDLASALYKLVYGSAKVSKKELKQTEGVKAFFANDTSKAIKEFNELKRMDSDLSGHIDREELENVRNSKVSISKADKLFEMFSTHPNMLRRIFVLSKYRVN